MSKMNYFPPPDSQGGWRALEDSRDILGITGMNKSKLDEAFELIKKDTKNGGLLVVKDGWLVYERYFGKGNREAIPNLASCGKSFTSIAMGILLSERPELFPEGLDQKVYNPSYLPDEAFPLTDPAKEDIKLGQLLAFTSGIRGNNPVYINGEEGTINPAGPDGYKSSLDPIAFGKEDYKIKGVTVSTRSLWCKPGGGYSYATSSIHLVSVIIRHITGMELQDYIEKYIGKPLGWGRWGFGYSQNSECIHTPGGGGIALRATDMLRFGYLLLNKGRWKDTQLVPAEYVKICSRKTPCNPHYPYSLQFNVNTDGDIPGFPRDAFWKSGSGGHCIYVIPSLHLVIWKLGGRDAQYQELDTGLLKRYGYREECREGWVQSIDNDTARIETLQKVVDSIY